MMKETKTVIKRFIPPIALHVFLLMIGKRTRWTGDYSTWREAEGLASGYDGAEIFNKARESTHKVVNGEAVWERDTVCFDQEEYNWPLVGCLMSALAGSKDRHLHVLDFGGALGSTYMQHKNAFERLDDFSWSVVEQTHFVKCGQKDFSNGKLNFYQNIEECFKDRPINVVLFSGVLQYLENPYQLLKEVVDLSPEAIIIDRTPFFPKLNSERITIQHVPNNIYNASYPCRFLNKEKVINLLSSDRVLSPWFKSSVDAPDFLGVMSKISTDT